MACDARHADNLRARLYELMRHFEDPYGDVQARNSNGNPPNHYGGPRYLPRGKRIQADEGGKRVGGKQ